MKPGRTILLAQTKIVPLGLAEDQYPTDAQIHENLSGYHVIVADVLGKSLELGDRSGRTANVVMMGILSTVTPFNVFPPEMWLNAIRRANSKPTVWAMNYAAFHAGREYAEGKIGALI